MTLHKGTELEAAIGSGPAVQAAILNGEGSSQEHHLLPLERHSCVNGFGDRPWSFSHRVSTTHFGASRVSEETCHFALDLKNTHFTDENQLFLFAAVGLSYDNDSCGRMEPLNNNNNTRSSHRSVFASVSQMSVSRQLVVGKIVCKLL